jgi:uncharacterized membrane protein YuzA (DUF378 family)
MKDLIRGSLIRVGATLVAIFVMNLIMTRLGFSTQETRILSLVAGFAAYIVAYKVTMKDKG